MTCPMIGTFTDSVALRMHKRIDSFESLVCAPYKWRRHFRKLTAPPCVLPTCGVAIERAVCRNVRLHVMTGWGRCSKCQDGARCLSCRCAHLHCWTAQSDVCAGCRTLNSIISILTSPAQSSGSFLSKMWNHWRLSLYVIMWWHF